MAHGTNPLNISLQGEEGRAIMDLVLSEPQAKIVEVEGVPYLSLPTESDQVASWVKIPEGVFLLA